MAKVILNVRLELEGGDADIFKEQYDNMTEQEGAETESDLKQRVAAATGMDVTMLHIITTE